MASPALKHTGIQAFEFPRRTNFHSIAEWVSVFGDLPASKVAPSEPKRSAAVDRRGAKAALVAIGLEAAVTLCVYGVWQAWQLLH